MTLQQLRYIIKIVEAGSMNRAAEKLFISQPSLSSAVRELEKEMGITIFFRSNRGIVLSPDGTKFLSYARQTVEQADLLEQQYKGGAPMRQVLSISTQHYAFAVNAFVNMIRNYNQNEYEFTLRESQTYEILEDVRNFRSEIGILYMSNFNKDILAKIIKESGLGFHPLFQAKPHIFISDKNPLAKEKCVTLDMLGDFPCLSFEQGNNNSFYFSEEPYSTLVHPKSIVVTDRATLFNLLIGLNGYTISSGILSADLNGSNIVSVPLVTDEVMNIGIICHSYANLSRLAAEYISELKKHLSQYSNSGTIS